MQTAINHLHVLVGSGNSVKIAGVDMALSQWPSILDFEVAGIDVPSGVGEQPKSLDATITGATQRAKHVWSVAATKEKVISTNKPCWAIGLEDGLMSVPQSKTGYLNVCVCVVFTTDPLRAAANDKPFVGLSSAFEYPQEIIDLVVNQGQDVSQAFSSLGICADKKIGTGQGAIGFLSDACLTRRFYVAQAVQAALAGMSKLPANTDNT